MSGVTGALVGAAVVGAGTSIYSANKSASAVSSASNNSIGEQQREYDLARQDQAPGRNAGDSALNQISKLYGLDTTDANGNVVKGSGKADFSSFTNSPDYQFESQQGEQAIDRSAAARGGLISGAALKAGASFADNLATTNFDDYYNHLAGVAGIGQAATNATQAAGTNTANSISGAYLNAGNARASAYGDVGQTIGNTVNGLGSNYLLSKYLNGRAVDPSLINATNAATNPAGTNLNYSTSSYVPAYN